MNLARIESYYLFFHFFNILFVIKAQLQDRYKQCNIINYATLITFNY